MILPMETVHLPGGERSEWVTTPQLLGHPKRLLLSHDTACLCRLEDIMIGNTSYFAAAGSIPAIHFHKELGTPEAIPLDLPIVHPGIRITIRILNDSPNAVRLQGGWDFSTSDEVVKTELDRMANLRTVPHDKQVLAVQKEIAQYIKNIAEMMKASQLKEK